MKGEPMGTTMATCANCYDLKLVEMTWFLCEECYVNIGEGRYE